MQVRLKVLQGSKTGKEIKLPTPQCLVGRSDECHLRPQRRHQPAALPDHDHGKRSGGAGFKKSQRHFRQRRESDRRSCIAIRRQASDRPTFISK